MISNTWVKQTVVTYTDFNKAFYSVNHPVLIEKLKLENISYYLILWFKSYLVDRSQKVKLNGFLSDPFPVPSGIPQRGHLFPLQFTILIMDIKKSSFQITK